MKRTVALAILGMAAVAVTSAYGQGAFQFSNYYGTPIVYDASIPGIGGTPVAAGEGVQIELWWGQGTSDIAVLEFGGIVNLSSYAGYANQDQVFELPAPPWAPGQTWTIQYRASGTAGGQAVATDSSVGPLVEKSSFGNQGVTPAELPVKYSTESGFTVFVPEPTSFALAGLGAAALMIFRRRD